MRSSQRAPLGRRLVAATMTKPTRCSKWAIIDAVEIETPERQMPELLPAISLVAVPGRRRQTLDIAREIERRGFAGIYIPSRFGNMAQCTALALATEHIPFGTAIAPIYARAAEIAEGVVFANASLSHMPQSLAVVPSPKRSDPNFLIGNMLPVCVSEDVDAAKALLRRRLVHYALLPNYRAYWKEAGYVDEMSAVEKAIADNRPDDIPKYLTDHWLADNTLFGPPAKVLEGVEAWRAAGVNTPVL